MEFEELYALCQWTVRHEILKWNVFARDRDDVEQDTWLDISNQYRNVVVPEGVSERAYMRGFARNKAKKACSKFFDLHWSATDGMKMTDKGQGRMNTGLAGLFQETEEDAGWVANQAWSSSAELTFLEQDRLPAFWAEVDKLPEKQRDCIVMRYDLEMLPEQIAEKMGLPTANSVGFHITKGIQTLRQRLNPDQTEYPSARLPIPRDSSPTCKNGHPWGEDNIPLFQGKLNKKVCVMCRKARDARYRAKRAA